MTAVPVPPEVSMAPPLAARLPENVLLLAVRLPTAKMAPPVRFDPVELLLLNVLPETLSDPPSRATPPPLATQVLLSKVLSVIVVVVLAKVTSPPPGLLGSVAALPVTVQRFRAKVVPSLLTRMPPPARNALLL